MHRLSLLLFVFLSLITRVNAGFVYSQNFDGLTVGQTQPFPRAPGRGGWYSVLAENGGFGEIQGAVANSGLALHQFTAATTPPDSQTIDRIELGSINVNHLPWVSLSFDFLGRTSDLDAVNSFQASILAGGGPFPGFEIIGAGIGAGNGTAKRETGLNLSLATFNGLDNNESIPLVVGQDLDFDAWHSVSIMIDQSRSLRVNRSQRGYAGSVQLFASKKL